jgi:hypothetical protein
VLREQDAAAGEGVEHGSRRTRVPEDTEAIGARRVEQEEDDVGTLAGTRADGEQGEERGRDRCGTDHAGGDSIGGRL